jgi:hypothetical protein
MKEADEHLLLLFFIMAVQNYLMLCLISYSSNSKDPKYKGWNLRYGSKAKVQLEVLHNFGC